MGGKKKRMGRTCNKNGSKRLFKVLRDSVPSGRKFPGRSKRILNLSLKQRKSPTTKKKENKKKK